MCYERARRIVGYLFVLPRLFAEGEFYKAAQQKDTTG